MSGAPVMQRLARALELEKVTSALSKPGVDLRRSVVLKRKAKAIRDELLGRRSAGAEGIDVMDPQDAMDRAVAHLQALKDSGAPMHQRIEDGAILRQVIKFSAKVSTTMGAPMNVSMQAHGMLNMIAKPDEMAEFNEFHLVKFTGAGVAVAAMEVKAKEAEAQMKELEKAEHIKMQALQSKFHQEIQDLTYAMSQQSISAIHEARWQLHKRVTTETENAKADSNARLMATMDHVGTPVIDSLLEASTIDAEAASQWALSQTITKQAETRLKKLGYPVQDVRRDMAEFHRLTGGRLGQVVIATNGSTRANATGIHGHDSAVINLGARFTKRTLWHEMGHHMEADPVILAAARGFLAKRSDGSGLHRLRALTGNDGFRGNEQAYRDSFFDPYVGKYYADATEVFSMGVESFSSPSLLGQRMAKDPEMFRMIEGALKTPANKLIRLVHDLRKASGEAQSEHMEKVADEREVVTKTLASSVQFAEGEGDVNSVGLDYFKRDSDKKYGLGACLGHMVNGDRGYVVYEAAKVRDRPDYMQRTRPKKGYLIVQLAMAGTADRYGGTAFTVLEVVGSLEDVKARALLWIKSGTRPMIQPSISDLKTYAA